MHGNGRKCLAHLRAHDGNGGGLVARVGAELGGGVTRVGAVEHVVDAQVGVARPVDAARHAVPQHQARHLIADHTNFIALCDLLHGPMETAIQWQKLIHPLQ